MSVRATARLKYVSIPPRKMRLVANMVKGLPVEKALNILNFTPRIAAHHIAKTLKSATANALSQEGTAQLRPESLCVKNIMVDDAPTAKRIQFQSMGRVFRIRKRHCHLTVVLEESDSLKATEIAELPKAKAKDEAPPKKRSKKAAESKATRKTSSAGGGKKPSGRKSTAGKAATKKVTSRKTSTSAHKGRTKAD
jgi:large subunit ribosomal protein L22